MWDMKDYFIRDELQPMWNHSEPNTSSGRWSGGGDGMAGASDGVGFQLGGMYLNGFWLGGTSFGWVAHHLVGRHILEWVLVGKHVPEPVLVGRGVHNMWNDYARHKMTMWDTRWLRAASGVCGEWQGGKGKGMWNTKHEMTMWDARREMSLSHQCDISLLDI